MIITKKNYLLVGSVAIVVLAACIYVKGKNPSGFAPSPSPSPF